MRPDATDRGTITVACPRATCGFEIELGVEWRYYRGYPATWSCPAEPPDQTCELAEPQPERCPEGHDWTLAEFVAFGDAVDRAVRDYEPDTDR